jgi:hypothetical protein
VGRRWTRVCSDLIATISGVPDARIAYVVVSHCASQPFLCVEFTVHGAGSQFRAVNLLTLSVQTDATSLESARGRFQIKRLQVKASAQGDLGFQLDGLLRPTTIPPETWDSVPTPEMD